MKLSQNAVRAIGLGIAGGMRATLPQFFIACSLWKNPSAVIKDSRLRFLQSATCTAIMAVAAMGELVVDKHPSTPNRTTAGGVIGRGIAGALAGGMVYKTNKENIWEGAAIGAGAAITATYLFYYLRRAIGKRTGVPDFIWGGVEDILALGTGYASTLMK